MNILILGDVFSKLGRGIIDKHIDSIKKENNINFTIINGENASHGKGLNENHYKWLMNKGANVVTLGNHSFHNKDIFNYIDKVNNLVRPYNYPEETKGKGYAVINYNGIKICVYQIIGEVFMKNPENTKSIFTSTDEVLENVSADIYICDFHGEATSEKVAYGLNYDGKVQIIYGTHTHVATNDLRILPNNTAYITDVGMCGPLNGVIGTKTSIILDRMINKGTKVFKPEDQGGAQLNGIVVTIDERTFKVSKVKQITIRD